MTAARDAYDPHRFRTTVEFYARHRLGYPERLVTRVIQHVGLKPGDAVLDLGCGPGLLAIPFALAGMRVTAVDPEPDMLAACTAAAHEAKVAIDVRRGSSFDLPPDIRPLRLVTMGRSFHWMDRVPTLAVLDKLVTADGAVALFHDAHPATVENGWHRVMRDLAGDFGRDKAAHVRARADRNYRSHDSILLESAFNSLESCGVIVKRSLTADDIVGRAFSLSMTSRAALGDRAAEFERQLREALAKLAPDGQFTEIAALEALIAMRR